MVPVRRNARDWLGYAAVVAFTLLFSGEFLAASGALSGCQDCQEYHTRPTSQTAGKPPAIAWVNASDQPAAPIDAYSCSHPQTQQQQNLCIAKDSEGAAEIQAYCAAIAVCIGVAGTFGLLVTMQLTRQSTLAAIEQSRIAREDFGASHRPDIIVIRMHLTEPPYPDDTVEVRFHVLNIGETRGEIEHVSALVYWQLATHTIPMTLPVKPWPITKSVIETGDFSVQWARSVELIDQQSIDNVARGLLGIFCVGSIIYRDRNGGRRIVGFARRHDRESSRFLPIKDETDYEYSY